MHNSIFSDNFCWTDEQREVLKSKGNTLIKGIAGSGKTILAIRKAFDLSKEGYSVGFIVYTKALKTFISDTIQNEIDDNIIFINYEYEWKKNTKVFDYIIIDEFQDFSLRTLQGFKSNTSKAIFCFGDLEQQLYERDLTKDKTISLVDLKSFDFDKTIVLKENFRIPNPIVRFVNQFHIGIKNPKALKTNSIESSIKPTIKNFTQQEDELNYIVEMIKKYSDRYSIGILLNRNNNTENNYTGAGEFFDQNIEEIPSILELQEYLSKKTKLEIGYKYKTENNLNFKKKPAINILTIHSSKGLEFDVVILPFSRISNSLFHLNQFYVAATRCKFHLIITYSGLMQIGFSKINTWNYDGIVKASDLG